MNLIMSDELLDLQDLHRGEEKTDFLQYICSLEADNRDRISRGEIDPSEIFRIMELNPVKTILNRRYTFLKLNRIATTKLVDIKQIVILDSNMNPIPHDSIFLSRGIFKKILETENNLRNISLPLWALSMEEIFIGIDLKTSFENGVSPAYIFSDFLVLDDLVGELSRHGEDRDLEWHGIVVSQGRFSDEQRNRFEYIDRSNIFRWFSTDGKYDATGLELKNLDRFSEDEIKVDFAGVVLVGKMRELDTLPFAWYTETKIESPKELQIQILDPVAEDREIVIFGTPLTVREGMIGIGVEALGGWEESGLVGE